MSPAASASQYLWSIPSHGLRDFELPPTGKENEVRVGPGGATKTPQAPSSRDLSSSPSRPPPTSLQCLPPDPHLCCTFSLSPQLPGSPHDPPISQPPEPPIWTRPKLLPGRAGLCLLQLYLSPNLALSRLPHLPVVPGRSSGQGFPAPCLSRPCSPPPPAARGRTHAAMPETPRSFDRLCPGGRPFLCRE